MAKQRLHRERFQAKGNGTEESVPWLLVKPITKMQADSSIARLESKLTPAERSASYHYCPKMIDKKLESAGFLYR